MFHVCTSTERANHHLRGMTGHNIHEEFDIQEALQITVFDDRIADRRQVMSQVPYLKSIPMNEDGSTKATIF